MELRPDSPNSTLMTAVPLFRDQPIQSPPRPLPASLFPNYIPVIVPGTPLSGSTLEAQWG